MAKIITCTILALGILSEARIALATPPALPPEVVGKQSIDAYKNYWSAFEGYEQELLKDGDKQFAQSWAEVKKSYQKQHAQISAEELSTLQEAASKYRKNLADHPQADNRPYVMLNLAQIQALIGEHLASEDPDAGSFARSEALALLQELEQTYRSFSYREQALYLRATLFEALGRDDEAFSAWQSLAATAQGTLYGVYARIAVGDHEFRRDRPGDAMRAYQKALSLLPSVNAEDPDYERLRIDYRLGWAAYRAGELDTTIAAASDLLAPGPHVRSADQREKTRQDAVELIGDALYENNVLSRTYAVLRRKDLAHEAGAIGLRTLKRYSANGVYAVSAELGENLSQAVPLAKELPEILQLTADAWDKQGNAAARIKDLERLSLLLPTQSLWRSRHHEDLAAVRAMEAAAIKAAVASAGAHYDTGLASGSPQAFLAASSYYEILINFAPNDEAANDWRLRRAHCQFFAGQNDEAARLYSSLKTDFKVDSETLQISSYQLVLTNEKRWRDSFAKAGEAGEDPYSDKNTLAATADLEKSVDEFVARFPLQSRSVDLLLVGASANRDMNRFPAASRYWQRVLVSQPSPTQRSIAVRGLIVAAMKNGSPADVVALARRYLKLEDWNALGQSLDNELRGVLAAATLQEGKVLNESGRVEEAGNLLVQIASEFSALPQRDKIYRDGAYLLAIAGDWNNAQHAAEGYFAAGLKENRADMTYLKARSAEYQLRLHEAAVGYLTLGETFPGHVRAATSLTRAERLAVAEGDFALAAKAATAAAARAPTDRERLADYTRAAEYLDKDNNAARGLQIARKAQRSSKTLPERLRAELLVARLTYKSGSEQEALDSLAILAKTIERSRFKLAPGDYAAVSGETHVLLAEEEKRRFSDFKLGERSGNPAVNVATKSRYFEEMVAEYDKAAAAGDPRWASESRFQIASAAEAFADEIAGVPARSGETQTLRSQNRYEATIKRLQELARKYYSTNVLTAQRDPSHYRDNDWVKKSALHLTGEASASVEPRHKDVMPSALQNNMPSEWSL